MKPQFIKLIEEYRRLTEELSATTDPEKLKTLGKKQADLDFVAEKIAKLETVEKSIAENSALVTSADKDISELARTESEQLEKQKKALEAEIEAEIIPKDPHDKNSAILEIRAGAGGDEASLFASELYRMYARFCEGKGLSVKSVSLNRNEVGGFKEIICEARGKDAYRLLKFESGVHRVQRVPKTEKSGRVHTSTATVAVMPIIPEEEFKISPSDLKIETSTSRGAGGQSVNTTYSAIKITHLPTGITASSQDERSQIQNRAKALEVLTARVFAHEEEKRMKQITSRRRQQIGTGDRSEKIRTYNFPQDRITDHRINQSFKQIGEVLDGKLDEIYSALREANQKILQENAGNVD